MRLGADLTCEYERTVERRAYSTMAPASTRVFIPKPINLSIGETMSQILLWLDSQELQSFNRSGSNSPLVSLAVVLSFFSGERANHHGYAPAPQAAVAARRVFSAPILRRDIILMALLSGTTISAWLYQPENAIANIAISRAIAAAVGASAYILGAFSRVTACTGKITGLPRGGAAPSSLREGATRVTPRCKDIVRFRRPSRS